MSLSAESWRVQAAVRLADNRYFCPCFESIKEYCEAGVLRKKFSLDEINIFYEKLTKFTKKFSLYHFFSILYTLFVNFGFALYDGRNVRWLWDFVPNSRGN